MSFLSFSKQATRIHGYLSDLESNKGKFCQNVNLFVSRVHIGREVMDVPEDFDRVELESGVGVAVLVDVVDAEDGDAVVRTAVHAVRVGHSLKVLLS